MSIKNLCKYFTVIISVVSLLCFSVTAHAETENYSIRIRFATESKPLAGSTFKVYHAMDTGGELVGGFASLSVEVGDLSDSSNVNRLASTLASYAVTGIAEPVSVAESDGLGCATFTGLSDGIYLVTGASVFIDDIMYTPKPTLIDFAEILGSTVTAGVKYTITANATDTNHPVSRTVKKIWEDNGNPNRPETVTVQLYRDEVLYEEKVLSAESGWEYTWNGLNPRYDWNVVETNVPDGYTVSLVPDGETFTVTNTGDFPDTPGTSTPTPATTAEVPATTNTATTATGSSQNTTVKSNDINTNTTVTGTSPANTTGSATNSTNTATNGTNTGTGTNETGGTVQTGMETSGTGTGTAGTDFTETDTTSSTGATGTSSSKTGGNSGNSTPSGNLGSGGFFGGNGGFFGGSSGGNTPILPQTGQLWYPVPILFLSGLFLFLIGFVAEDDNEKK